MTLYFKRPLKNLILAANGSSSRKITEKRPKVRKALAYVRVLGEHKDIPTEKSDATCAGIGLEPVSCGAGGGRPRVVPVRIPLVCTVYAIISHKKFTAL